MGSPQSSRFSAPPSGPPQPPIEGSLLALRMTDGFPRGYWTRQSAADIDHRRRIGVFVDRGLIDAGGLSASDAGDTADPCAVARRGRAGGVGAG
jgi:hypothetical protein